MQITDPCDGNTPELKDPVAVSDKTYMLGDNALVFSHPEFEIVPNYCTVTYTYTNPSLSNGKFPITRTDRQFTIFYLDDDTPVSEGPFEIVITGRSGSKYG